MTGVLSKEITMPDKKNTNSSKTPCKTPLKVMETAILVDGGFYLKRAKCLFGPKTPQDRAAELDHYCRKHISKTGDRHLYRVFYYDCPPSENVIWNPLTQKNTALSKTELYSWTKDFHSELTHKRKFALRMGELLDTTGGYSLNYDALKKLRLVACAQQTLMLSAC